MVTADREQAFAGSYTWDRATAQADSAFVTPTFTLREPGTVEIAIQTTLLNSWMAFDLALIDLGTGTAYNVAEEVSYYSGSDSDGTWTEGSQRGRVLLPRMAAGEYYLRVEPEADPALQRHVYSITVRRDVPSLTPYGVAALLLLVPPVWLVVRLLSFEHRRLQESDYGG
jgi:hypothetical protein